MSKFYRVGAIRSEVPKPGDLLVLVDQGDLFGGQVHDDKGAP
jgi:hypothetical protein